MTFAEYQEQARRTQNPALMRGQRQDHALFGLASEVGEVHSIFQHYYQGEHIDTDRLAKEIGDVLWFIAELCDALRFNMDDVASGNIAKLKRRYPDAYTDEASVNRTER